MTCDWRLDGTKSALVSFGLELWRMSSCFFSSAFTDGTVQSQLQAHQRQGRRFNFKPNVEAQSHESGTSTGMKGSGTCSAE